MTAPSDTDTVTGDETTAERDQLSRLRRYDQRLEEWLTSLKDEAGQRSPEVLGALAAKAKDVAEYLERMAEKARSRNEASGATQPTEAASRTEESTAMPELDTGSSIT
jgi:septal ring factor EnvC (AmiA/AmiB activator)